jgi:hypothetical protein
MKIGGDRWRNASKIDFWGRDDEWAMTSSPTWKRARHHDLSDFHESDSADTLSVINTEENEPDEERFTLSSRTLAALPDIHVGVVARGQNQAREEQLV